MKIYHKDAWNFLFFKRYAFFLEDKQGCFTEIVVSKKEWDKYKEGDNYEPKGYRKKNSKY